LFIRSEAEGSAVHSAFATKVRGKNKFVIPAERTRISCHAALGKATCAPFRTLRLMRFARTSQD